jgi:hypothetical protein
VGHGLSRVMRGRRRRREAGMEGQDEENDDEDWSVLLGRRLGLVLIPGSGPDQPV